MRQRIDIYKIKDILRLKHEKNMSVRDIAKICNVGRQTVANYIHFLTSSMYDWNSIKEMSNSNLQELLIENSKTLHFSNKIKKDIPDFDSIHLDLLKTNKNIKDSWIEYSHEHANSYKYEMFCRLYRKWKEKYSILADTSSKYGRDICVGYIKVPEIKYKNKNYQNETAANFKTDEINISYVIEELKDKELLLHMIQKEFDIDFNKSRQITKTQLVYVFNRLLLKGYLSFYFRDYNSAILNIINAILNGKQTQKINKVDKKRIKSKNRLLLSEHFPYTLQKPIIVYFAYWRRSKYLFMKCYKQFNSENTLRFLTDSFRYFNCVPHYCTLIESKSDNRIKYLNEKCFAKHYNTEIRLYSKHNRNHLKLYSKFIKESILDHLENKCFDSIESIDYELNNFMTHFNNKPMLKLDKSPLELFNKIDKPDTLNFNNKEYEYARWKKIKVRCDFHINYSDNYYSVPYLTVPTFLVKIA